MLGVAADRLGDPVVAGGEQVRGDHPVLAVDLALAVALGGPAGVIADDHDQRQVEADGRVELQAVKAEGAVSKERDGAAVWPGDLRGDGERDGRPDPAEVQPDELGAAAITAALLYAPVMMMFWFSPPLVAWHAAPPAKALFYSAAAFLMNWRAFAAYGVACLAGTLLLSAAMLVGAAALGVPPMALVTPVLLVLLPLLFASFYASYRDIFAVAPK